jgi:hypothetical protein
LSTDRRPEFIQGTWFEDAFKPFSTGNQIVFDVAVGVVVSLLVYVLVVGLPAWQKKKRIKAYLLRRYDDLKRSCITHFLWACGEPASSDLIDELKTLERFKEFFKTRISEDQDRWYAVLNGLTEEYVTGLVRHTSASAEIRHFGLSHLRTKERTLAGIGS